jgi:hypothetical protein
MKRSSSRRTYKKRRTFRKSRSNRHRKTQRGGFEFGQFKGMGLGNMNFNSPEQSHSPSIHPGNTPMLGTFGKAMAGTAALGLGAFALKKGYGMYKNRQARSAPAAQAPGPGLSVVGKAMNLQPKFPSKFTSKFPSKFTSKLPF